MSQNPDAKSGRGKRNKNKITPITTKNLLRPKMRLAIAYSNENRHQKSMQLMEECLELSMKMLPPGHSFIGECMYNLASECCSLYMFDKALQHGKDALAVFQSGLPEEHSYISRAMNNVAFALHSLRKYDEALGLLNQLLTRYKRILPPGDPKICKIESWIDMLQPNLL